MIAVEDVLSRVARHMVAANGNCRVFADPPDRR